MGRAGAKRSKAANDESPSSNSASKKPRTEKNKIAPKKVEEAVDPFLKTFSEKFKQPEDAIQFLVQNAKTSVADFIKNNWGRKPIAMKADEASKDLGKVFSLELIEKIIEQDVDLIPGRDFLFSKVVDGKLEESDAAELNKATLKSHRDDKFTIQFNQPQRFQDCIWSFMEKLECYLGSLVSCQAFLVPGGTQSHPLRYDDTEKFIVQLSGGSSWKLFSPKKEQIEAFNDDVKAEDVGDECLAADLSAGDVLYIPKGIISESIGKETGVYLSFGAAQDMNYANLVGQTIEGLIGEELLKVPELRQVLPPGYLLRTSLVSTENYAEVLTKLVESIKSREAPLPVAQAMLTRFMAGRLPPFGVKKSEPELNGRISKDTKISLRNKEHITWFIRTSAEGLGMDEDDADEETAESHDLGPQSELVVLSSLSNDKSRHMTINAELEDYESDAFSIAAHYKGLMEKLEKSEKPIKVESLTEGMEKADSINPVLLANALNNIGAISVSK